MAHHVTDLSEVPGERPYCSSGSIVKEERETKFVRKLGNGGGFTGSSDTHCNDHVGFSTFVSTARDSCDLFGLPLWMTLTDF